VMRIERHEVSVWGGVVMYSGIFNVSPVLLMDLTGYCLRSAKSHYHITVF